MVPGSSDFNEQQASIIVMDIFEFKGLKFFKDKLMRKLEMYTVHCAIRDVHCTLCN